MKMERSRSNIYEELDSEKENSMSKSSLSIKGDQNEYFESLVLYSEKEEASQIDDRSKGCQCLGSIKDNILVCPFLNFPEIEDMKHKFAKQVESTRKVSKEISRMIEENCIFQKIRVVCFSIDQMEKFVFRSLTKQEDTLWNKRTEIVLLGCLTKLQKAHPEMVTGSIASTIFKSAQESVSQLESTLQQIELFCSSLSKGTFFFYTYSYIVIGDQERVFTLTFNDINLQHQHSSFGLNVFTILKPQESKVQMVLESCSEREDFDLTSVCCIVLKSNHQMKCRIFSKDHQDSKAILRMKRRQSGKIVFQKYFLSRILVLTVVVFSLI